MHSITGVGAVGVEHIPEGASAALLLCGVGMLVVTRLRSCDRWIITGAIPSICTRNVAGRWPKRDTDEERKTSSSGNRRCRCMPERLLLSTRRKCLIAAETFQRFEANLRPS